MKNNSLFFLCLLAQVPVFAQLDTTFYNGSVLAARNGQIVFQQSHGWANIEDRIPNKETTNFELASLSKVFTALQEWGPLKLAPRQQWSYSSPGIGLLALVVEQVSHVSFQAYLSKHIFKPAGMVHTYLHNIKDSTRARPYNHRYYFSSDYEWSDTVPRRRRLPG